MTATTPVAQRFWKFVAKGDGCWEWTGAKTASGYGMFRVSTSRRTCAHRVAYEFTPENTHLKDGKRVCRACNRLHQAAHRAKRRAA